MRTRQERLRSRNSRLRLENEPALERGRVDEVHRHRPGAEAHSYPVRSSCPSGPPILFDDSLCNRVLDVLLGERPPERGKLQFVEPFKDAPLSPRLDADRFSARRIEGDLVAGFKTPGLAVLRGYGDLSLAGERRENLVGHARPPYEIGFPYFKVW